MIRAALIAAIGGALAGGLLYVALGILLRHVDDARWQA